MASIFKPTGRNKFRIQYTDPETGKQMTVPGFADRKATEAKARDLERRAERIAAGLPVANQEIRKSPIIDLIDKHLAHMTAQGLSPKHIKDAGRLLHRIIRELEWQTLAQVRVDPFSAFIDELRATPDGRRHKNPAALPPSRPASPRTRTAYRQAAYHFLQFCCRRGWLEDNPLKHTQPPKQRKVRLRRAYTAEEFARLCNLEPHGPLYMIAGLSGFRRGELKLMEKRDLSPRSDTPAWHPRPEIVKGRRSDVLPILPELLPIVRHLWDSLPEPGRLFHVMPKNATLRRDLAAAKIPRQDPQGRYADFHSFRYFFCTTLAKLMPIQEVQRMMRHKDVRMTSGLYNDLGLTDLWGRIKNLPPLDLKLPTMLPLTLPLTLPSHENPAFSATKDMVG